MSQTSGACGSGNDGISNVSSFTCNVGTYITSVAFAPSYKGFNIGMQATCSDGKDSGMGPFGGAGPAVKSTSGFTGFNQWCDTRVYGYQFVPKGGTPTTTVGWQAGSQASFNCPTTMVVTGFNRATTHYGGSNDVDSLAYVTWKCDYPVDCTIAANAFNSSCAPWCTANPALCKLNQTAFCSGANLSGTNWDTYCNAYCSAGGDPCSANLQTFCNASDSQLSAYPTQCGCHMGTTYYNNFFAKLTAAAPELAALPQFPDCYFKACAVGGIKPATRNTCVPFTACISNISVQNQGVINGAIAVTASNSCGNAASPDASSTSTSTNTNTNTSTNTSSDDASLLIPSLPATLFGLSQIVYLIIGAVVAMLVIVIGVVSVLTGGKHDKKKKRRAHKN
jgi:hypothetical protein